MKLAKQSIPYRALQKVSGVVVLLFFLATANEWGLAIAVGGSLAVLLVAGAYELAYYRRFEYELTEDTLDISSGVISRREREIPYRRIQNVDVSRNVIQRALGIAAVDLETAGGSSTEGAIRYVVPAEATRLRREIQRRKSDASTGVDADGDPTGPVETDLFAITPGELALVGALSFDGRLIGLLAFLGSGSFPVLSGFLPDASAAILTAFAIVAVGALFLVSWILGAGIAFSNYYGFRLARAGDELRYERGLFRRYSGSIPLEKVQTLMVSDNPAKRALGYATLSIETAGYAPGQGGEYGSQAAVPIARTERVYDLAREVETFGEPEFSRPPKRIRWRYVFRYTLVLAALTGIAFAVDWWIAGEIPWYLLAGLLVAVPPAAHLKWKHRGYWLGENHLLTRNGFWSREVRIVPYYRIQNVIDTRTVFQRRWHVATVVADTAGTNSIVGHDAAAVDFDIEEAERLRETLQERLQEALRDRRARRTAFEWFDGDDVDGEGVDGDDAGDVDGMGSEFVTAADSAADTEAASSTDGPSTSDSAREPDDDSDRGGVVRPEFTRTERDYSEPADPIDTGEYAVDRYPSDADVAHRNDETTDDRDETTDDRDETTDDRDGDR
ncbi:PH domain-containing protein [Halorubrum luteum]